jgi:hypothetical protein
MSITGVKFKFRKFPAYVFLYNGKLLDIFYFTIRGGSLKKMEKNIIPKVPTNKKV